jgi:hypothetical protein
MRLRWTTRKNESVEESMYQSLDEVVDEASGGVDGLVSG